MTWNGGEHPAAQEQKGKRQQAKRNEHQNLIARSLPAAVSSGPVAGFSACRMIRMVAFLSASPPKAAASPAWDWIGVLRTRHPINAVHGPVERRILLACWSPIVCLARHHSLKLSAVCLLSQGAGHICLVTPRPHHYTHSSLRRPAGNLVFRLGPSVGDLAHGQAGHILSRRLKGTGRAFARPVCSFSGLHWFGTQSHGLLRT